MMGSYFVGLINKMLERGGLLKEANLFISGDWSSFEVETSDGTYKVTISKKEEVNKNA